MDIDRMITKWGEILERRIDSAAPWVIGFAFVYFTGHVLVALLKGWI